MELFYCIYACFSDYAISSCPIPVHVGYSPESGTISPHHVNVSRMVITCTNEGSPHPGATGHIVQLLLIVLNLQAELRSTDEIESVKMELEITGFANAAYDNVMFKFHPNFASEHLLAVGNWDEARRHSVREVLREARKNFHRHPRPW